MRQTPLPPDAAAAARHLEFARYVARVAQIGPVDGESMALRKAALANRDPTRSQPARMILEALDKAEGAMVR